MLGNIFCGPQEPNSALGDAIFYMKNHWTELVQFLLVPGVPLDNSLCERALKKAILHRKESLFYKTQNGAQVGDLFMSLIYTCERCGADHTEKRSE
jgi:transposase